MKMRLTSAALFLTVLSCVLVAQQTQGRKEVCASVKSSLRPVFLNSDEGAKLYLDELKADPQASDTGAQVVALMLRSGLRTAWIRAQVLVDEQGQVQGIQSIDGTPEVLSTAVREVRRYRFKPYNPGSGATPFVTILKIKYDTREPACSLANPSGCR